MSPVELWWSSLLAAEQGLLGLLDDVERARVRSLERPADQGRSMVAAALLRVAVGERLGVAPADVVVDRTCAECGRPHGRPRVTGPGVVVPHVSVSHSGLLVVVAVGDVPVGVDVQRVADVRADEPMRGTAAREWVLREAVVKATGAPAEPASRDVPGLRTGPRTPPAVRLVTAPREGYAAALATGTDRSPADDELVVTHWRGGPGAR